MASYNGIKYLGFIFAVSTVNFQNLLYFKKDVSGSNLLSWIETNGVKHEIESLGDSTCNDSPPEWLSNFDIINDKDLLPIKAFKYGPLKCASQMSVINIGPLRCSPKN